MNLETIRSYEQQIIGCALLAPETVDASLLSTENFSTAWGRRVWEALMRLALNGDPVNEVIVAEQSSSKVADLCDATNAACLPAQVPWFSKQIRAAAYRRRLLATCAEAVRRIQEANGAGVDPTPEVVAKLTVALDDTSLAEQPKRLTYFVEQIVAELPARREKGKPGLPTGFPTVDKLTGGLRNGSLWGIAAATGVGKSLTAANIALSAGVPSVIFSLEMAGIEVAERLVAAASGIHALRLQRGTVSEDEMLVLRREADRHQRIWIDERPAPSVAEIGATSRTLHRREGVGLIVVDYLQIVRTEQDERREAEVAAVARGLRALARRLNVPVIALAQLNRDGQIRDSAVIEHEAHVIAVLERKRGSESATLELRKNRHGPEDSIVLHFDRQTLRLREEHEPCARPPLSGVHRRLQ